MPKGLAHSFFIPYEMSRWVEVVSDIKRIYIKFQVEDPYNYVTMSQPNKACEIKEIIHLTKISKPTLMKT